MLFPLDGLRAEKIGHEIIDKIELFVNVTELFGQIYVARGIGLKSR